ncbi:MAG: hypothetical protein ACJ76S_11955 [Solirubrobacteraceae bacterium]
MNSVDRIAFLGQAAIYGLATLPDEIRRALGIRRRRLAGLDASLIKPPDSQLAREAEELIAAVVPAMVVNHCHRTYAWGAALALHDGLRFDGEVVYLASLLHDLHFADPNAMAQPHCFTLPAAERATSLGAQAGWDKARCELAAEAITLHLNLRPPQNSPEAYAVYAGARLDVAGYRYGDLHPDALATVLERHPRLQLKRDSAPMFEAQAESNPGSRAHFYTRYLAVNWFVRRAPFEE